MTSRVTVRARRSSGREDASRTRVLVVGPLPPPVHGTSVLTAALLHSRFTEAYDVVHADITDPRPLGNIGRLDAGNVWYALRHGSSFGRLLVRARPDIVYIPVSQNALGFLRDALFLAPTALSGRPYIVHFHGSDFDTFRAAASPALRAGIDALIGRAHAAVVQGHALRDMLHGVIRPERVVVVPNGVADTGPPSDRAARSGRPIVAWLANLREEKGLLDLVEAAARLIERGADAEFVLAGGVSDEAAYRRAAAIAAPLGHRVRFTGVLDDRARAALLAEADLFVLPSHSEAHPLALLEAMAAGLPAVTTRTGAVPETVTDGVTGVLVPPRDVAALGSALERLIDDRALRVSMGTAARQRYVEEYTLDRWVGRMIEVFRSVPVRVAA